MTPKERDKKITDNLGLVGSTLKMFKNTTIPKEDLYQAGCIGLVDAVDKYKGNTGVVFSTYAVINIRNHMLKALEQWNRFLRSSTAVLEEQQFEGEPMTIVDYEFNTIDKLEKIAIYNMEKAVSNNQLSLFEKEILMMRCGIGYYKVPTSSTTIGTICKMSRKRAADTITDAISKIKRKTNNQYVSKTYMSSLNPRALEHF